MKQKCFIVILFRYLCIRTKLITAMRMCTFAANQMRDIENFVNESGIKKENIVDIFQSKDGDFELVYYAE